MIPNIYIYERLMVERHQERQQEMAHYRQALVNSSNLPIPLHPQNLTHLDVHPSLLE